MIGKNAGTVAKVDRFPVHDERIDERGRPELENHRRQQSGDAAGKHDRAEPRFAEAHRVVHSVNRKR